MLNFLKPAAHFLDHVQTGQLSFRVVRLTKLSMEDCVAGPTGTERERTSACDCYVLINLKSPQLARVFQRSWKVLVSDALNTNAK